MRDVNTINKSRINKSTYMYDCLIPNHHTRIGISVVEDLIDRATKYYSKYEVDGEFTAVDKKDIANFSWIPLELYNRNYDPRNRNIFCPEKPFEIEIDAEWAYYHFILKDVEVYGTYRIKGTIDLITQIDDSTLEIVDWKGLPVETPIPTPSGWTTMGELKVDDKVFDKDGNICTVKGKSKVKFKQCYKIIFDDKTEVECDDEHLWYLLDGSVVPITELKIGDKIPTLKSIKTTRINLPIDPYVLGVWLGDGRNRCGEISGEDDFIFEEISRRGYTIGKNIGGKNKTQSKTVFNLTNQLKELNLINNKHIPEIYFRASHEQRLELLRGLMDTDGNVNSTRKQAVFTSCNKKLSDDVKKLLITLGQRVNQANISRDTNFKKNVKIFPLSFRPIDINPFLIPRKANKIISEWGNGNSNRKIIKNIILLDYKKNTQCIMVDSPSNTYLCTENMVVTHNTGARKDWGTGKVKDYDYLMSDKQLLLYYYAARKCFPEFKNIIITIFFIRDGGPYTLCFGDSDMDRAEKMLEKHFKEVSSNDKPRPIDVSQKDFKCNRLCHFYKNSLPNTKDNICKHIQKELYTKGIEKVIDEYIQPGFTLDRYHSPGA